MPVRQVLTCKRVHLSGSEAGAGKTQLASVDGTSHTGLLPLADRRTGPWTSSVGLQKLRQRTIMLELHQSVADALG